MLPRKYRVPAMTSSAWLEGHCARQCRCRNPAKPRSSLARAPGSAGSPLSSPRQDEPPQITLFFAPWVYYSNQKYAEADYTEGPF
jgi:hypothetical protein